MNLYKNNKMKKFHKIFAIAVLSVITFSCVEDDDFSIPDTAAVDIEAPANLIDMSAVISQIEQSFTGTITFESDNSQYTEGYVISSDEAGNYFEELIIQDATENPTAGIKILVDNSPLFTTYTLGQRVYIKLDGLTAGISNGVPVLGIAGIDGNIEKISPALQDQVILRDSEVFTITPKEVNGPTEFTSTPLLTLIVLPQTQFTQQDIDDRRTFASEATDQFDGVRFLQTCSDFAAAPIRLETSTFSDFKALRLPNGSGSVSAILQRDFEDDNYVIAVNSTEDFNFDPSTRCDFLVTSCGTVASQGTNTLLNEDFEAQSTGLAAMPTGWTNFIEAGSVFWEVFTDANSLGRSARVRPFRSGDASNIAWLITPVFDFDAQTGEVVTFQSSFDFYDSSVNMQALFSSDWDGTTAGITTATWEPLSDAIIADQSAPLSHGFNEWPTSGNVSLDCVTGTGAIAFKYVGSGDSSNDVTYELDNISLTSD